jgi:hypothetical protein
MHEVVRVFFQKMKGNNKAVCGKGRGSISSGALDEHEYCTEESQEHAQAI